MRQQLLRNVQAVTAVFGHMEVKMHMVTDSICDRMIITQRRLLQDAQDQFTRAAMTNDHSAAAITLLYFFKQMDCSWREFRQNRVPQCLSCCDAEFEVVQSTLSRLAEFAESAQRLLPRDKSDEPKQRAIVQSCTIRHRDLGKSFVNCLATQTSIATDGPCRSLREKYAQLLCSSTPQAVVGSSGSTRRTLSTVLQSSAFVPDVLRLYDLQHPSACVYSTHYDRCWAATDAASCHFDFLYSTIAAELQVYRDSYGAIPSFTALHVMNAMGFATADIAAMIVDIDAAFYRLVSHDTHLNFLVHKSAVRVGLYRTTMAYTKLCQFVTLNSSLLFDISDTLSSKVEAATDVADSASPPVFSTILCAINRWQSENSAGNAMDYWPLPVYNALGIMETRFLQDCTHVGASADIWAWPIQLRFSYVAFIKQWVWRLKTLPPTPTILTVTGFWNAEQDDLVHAFGEWWRQGSNCRGIRNEDNDELPPPLKQRLESWVQTDIASPDTSNVHDEINMVVIQQQCNKRLQRIPTDTDLDAVQQGLARISALLVGDSYTQATQRQEDMDVHRKRFSAADTL